MSVFVSVPLYITVPGPFLFPFPVREGGYGYFLEPHIPVPIPDSGFSRRPVKFK